MSVCVGGSGVCVGCVRGCGGGGRELGLTVLSGPTLLVILFLSAGAALPAV